MSVKKVKVVEEIKMGKMNILIQHIGIAIVSIFAARGAIWLLTKTGIESGGVGFAYSLLILSFIIYFIMIGSLYD